MGLLFPLLNRNDLTDQASSHGEESFSHVNSVSEQAITQTRPAIFHGCKNVNFQIKFLIFFLFLLKTLIVGTRLNRLNEAVEAVLTSTHNLCFGAKIRKKKYTPVNPSFTI